MNEKEKLEKELQYYIDDLESTEKMIDDKNIHFTQLTELRNDVLYDKKKIDEIKLKLKQLEKEEINNNFSK